MYCLLCASNICFHFATLAILGFSSTSHMQHLSSILDYSIIFRVENILKPLLSHHYLLSICIRKTTKFHLIHVYIILITNRLHTQCIVA